MVERRDQQGFDWGSLIIGILYVIAGFIALNNPFVGAISILYIIAFGAILKGIFELAFRSRISTFTGNSPTWLLVIGIIDIIIGVLIIFNIGAGIIALPFLFALWFIIDSIQTLVAAPAFRQISEFRFWFNIVIGILGIIVGILLIFNPFASFLTLEMLVGIFLIIAGIGHVVNAF